MSQELITYGGDRRLVLSLGEAIRQPVYMPYSIVTGSASAATDLVTAAAHGMANGEKILVTGSGVPTGLTAGSYYFVRDVTTNTFKVTATSGGAAIDLTTDGTSWSWIRQPWTSLRIGLRGHLVGSTNITSTPRMAFGICTGNTNGYGAASSTHVLGARFGATTLTYHAGPPPYFDFGTVGRFKRVGTTVTETTGSGTMFFSADSSVRNGAFIEIVKATTNATVSCYGPTASTAAQSDLTDSEFAQIMEIPAASLGGSISSVKASYGVWVNGTVAVNEATDGILDNLFVHWDHTSHQFSFDIKHRWLT